MKNIYYSKIKKEFSEKKDFGDSLKLFNEYELLNYEIDVEDAFFIEFLYAIREQFKKEFPNVSHDEFYLDFFNTDIWSVLDFCEYFEKDESLFEFLNEIKSSLKFDKLNSYTQILLEEFIITPKLKFFETLNYKPFNQIKFIPE